MSENDLKDMECVRKQGKKVKVKSFSHVRLLVTPWTAAHQAPRSMGLFQARVLEWGAIALSPDYPTKH